MQKNWFQIDFTRRHISRTRAVKSAVLVYAAHPLTAARRLLRAMQAAAPAGVFSVKRVAPCGDVSYADVAKRLSRRMRRNPDMDAAQREVYSAVKRGCA